MIFAVENDVDLAKTPAVIPLPWLYVLAIERGNWREAATACIGMMRREGDTTGLWGMRLRGVLRARTRGWGRDR